MRPRVLFVGHTGYLGGAELYLLDVVCRLHSTGHVLLFEKGPFLDHLKREAVPAFVLEAPSSIMRVRRLGRRMQDLIAVPAVLSMARKVSRMAQEYDVLYANSQKAFIICALAGRLARRPVIWNLHDILTASHFSEGHRRVAVSFANRLADRIIANSEATHKAFIDSGGDADKTCVVPNGIDAAPFRQITESVTRDLRASLGLDGEVVVGLFGRLAPWKGQHVLVEALTRCPNVHALLVGGALFQDDASYERKLRALAADLRVEDRIHFAGPRDDVAGLMKSVDMVVHCSTSPEPFGRVIVEGMLAAKPVIAARAGGALEILTDGLTGVLVEPGDSAGLAEAIQQLQADPRKAREIAERGYAFAQERFDIDRVVGQLEREIGIVAGEISG